MFSLTFLDVRLADLTTNQRDIEKHPFFLLNRAKHDEIQTSLDEIKAFDFDEIKSVFIIPMKSDFITK